AVAAPAAASAPSARLAWRNCLRSESSDIASPVSAARRSPERDPRQPERGLGEVDEYQRPAEVFVIEATEAGGTGRRRGRPLSGTSRGSRGRGGPRRGSRGRASRDSRP